MINICLIFTQVLRKLITFNCYRRFSGFAYLLVERCITFPCLLTLECKAPPFRQCVMCYVSCFGICCFQDFFTYIYMCKVFVYSFIHLFVIKICFCKDNIIILLFLIITTTLRLEKA